MGQKRNEDDLINIGNRLKSARLALGLSQKDIYEAIGVKNHWESGKRIPDPLAMRDLYFLYGVTLPWDGFMQEIQGSFRSMSEYQLFLR